MNDQTSSSYSGRVRTVPSYPCLCTPGTPLSIPILDTFEWYFNAWFSWLCWYLNDFKQPNTVHYWSQSGFKCWKSSSVPSVEFGSIKHQVLECIKCASSIAYRACWSWFVHTVSVLRKSNWPRAFERIHRVESFRWYTSNSSKSWKQVDSMDDQKWSNAHKASAILSSFLACKELKYFACTSNVGIQVPIFNTSNTSTYNTNAVLNYTHTHTLHLEQYRMFEMSGRMCMKNDTRAMITTRLHHWSVPGCIPTLPSA